jgi:hypothetical protein
MLFDYVQFCKLSTVFAHLYVFSSHVEKNLHEKVLGYDSQQLYIVYLLSTRTCVQIVVVMVCEKIEAETIIKIESITHNLSAKNLY